MRAMGVSSGVVNWGRDWHGSGHGHVGWGSNVDMQRFEGWWFGVGWSERWMRSAWLWVNGVQARVRFRGVEHSCFKSLCI